MKLIVVPWLPSARKGFTTYAITVAPFVLILKSQKDNAALLAHEQVHLDQVKEMGWINFYWRYATDLNFRASVEAAGYLAQRTVEEKGRT